MPTDLTSDRGYMWDDSQGLARAPKNARDTHVRSLEEEPRMTPMLLASGEGRNPEPGSLQAHALLT